MSRATASTKPAAAITRPSMLASRNGRVPDVITSRQKWDRRRRAE